MILIYMGRGGYLEQSAVMIKTNEYQKGPSVFRYIDFL